MPATTDRATDLHDLDRCDHDMPLAATCPACSPDHYLATTSAEGRRALRMANVFGGGAQLTDTNPGHVVDELRRHGYIRETDTVLTLAGQVAASLAVDHAVDRIRAGLDGDQLLDGRLFAVRGTWRAGCGWTAVRALYLTRARTAEAARRHAVAHTASPVASVTLVEDVTDARDAFARFVAEVPAQRTGVDTMHPVDIVAHRLRLFGLEPLLVNALAEDVRTNG